MKYFFAVFLYVGLSWIKMRAYLGEGRFIFEDKVFYENFYNQSLSHNLGYLFNGHLELPTNFTIAISHYFKFVDAPLVIVWTSYLFQSLVVLILIFYYRQIGLNFAGLLICIVGYVGLPQSTEVWTNAVNLHFHFACLAALILVIPTVTTSEKWLTRLLLVLSGLSGIPANFLLPVYIWRYLQVKDKERLVQACLLGTTTMIQLSLIMMSSLQVGDRHLLVNPLLYVLPAIPQVLITPVFGWRLGDVTAELAKKALIGDPTALLFVAISILAVFILLKKFFLRANENQKILMYAGMALYAGCVVGSLGDKSSLIATASGLRYFFSANFVWIVCLASYATAIRSWPMWIVMVVFLVSASTRVNKFMGGPSWQDAYKQAMQNGDSAIPTWPSGWGAIRNYDLINHGSR